MLCQPSVMQPHGEPPHGPHNPPVPVSRLCPGLPPDAPRQTGGQSCLGHLSCLPVRVPVPASHRCSSPSAAASGEEHPADGPTVLPGLGRDKAGEGALRPRTHFIPSHLYWISWISGLRELVYPIRLDCKGHLPAPASPPGAMGCSAETGMGTRQGGSCRQRYSLLPTSQQPPPNPHHCHWGAQMDVHPSPSHPLHPPTRCRRLDLLVPPQGANLVPNRTGDGGAGIKAPTTGTGACWNRALQFSH